MLTKEQSEGLSAGAKALLDIHNDSNMKELMSKLADVLFMNQYGVRYVGLSESLLVVDGGKGASKLGVEGMPNSLTMAVCRQIPECVGFTLVGFSNGVFTAKKGTKKATVSVTDPRIVKEIQDMRKELRNIEKRKHALELFISIRTVFYGDDTVKQLWRRHRLARIYNASQIVRQFVTEILPYKYSDKVVELATKMKDGYKEREGLRKKLAEEAYVAKAADDLCALLKKANSKRLIVEVAMLIVHPHCGMMSRELHEDFSKFAKENDIPIMLHMGGHGLLGCGGAYTLR
jgi:hypothetical protein